MLGGTYVIATSTREGVVICADKRLSTEAHVPVTDGFVKIRQIGQQGIYSATGHFILTHKRNISFLNPTFIDFDLFSHIDDYFRNQNTVKLEDAWAILGKDIANSLQKIEPEVLNVLFPPKSEERTFIFQTLFCYFDQQHNLKGEFLSCTLDQRERRFYVTLTPLPDKQFHTSLPMTMGATAVYLEILSGTDKRFNDLRADKSLKAFVSGTIPINKMTADKAALLSKRLIQLTSERVHLLDPVSQVSPNSDCALLSYKQGVKWQ